MGTALKHAVDLLAILPNNYNTFYGENSSDFRDFVKSKFLKSTLTGNSMDRRLEQFNRESMKMTILKHEEIFKEQVRELHRLYKVQRILMAELSNNAPKLHSPTNPCSRTIRIGGECIERDNRTGFWPTATTSETNQTPFSNWNNSHQSNSGHNFHSLFSMRAEPSLQEQSSSCSRDTSKVPKGFDLERPAEELSANISAIEDQHDHNSLKKSCDPCFYNDGESEVELTLSIGFGTSKKKSKHRKPRTSQDLGRSGSNNYERRQLEHSLSVKSGGEECSEPANSPGSASATCDRESLQQPPWLFQTLSLNRM